MQNAEFAAAVLQAVALEKAVGLANKIEEDAAAVGRRRRHSFKDSTATCAGPTLAHSH